FFARRTGTTPSQLFVPGHGWMAPPLGFASASRPALNAAARYGFLRAAERSATRWAQAVRPVLRRAVRRFVRPCFGRAGHLARVRGRGGSRALADLRRCAPDGARDGWQRIRATTSRRRRGLLDPATAGRLRSRRIESPTPMLARR